MTRKTAVERAMQLRPSEVTVQQLLKWLCDLDGQLMLVYIAQYATNEQLEASYNGLGIQDGIQYIDEVVETNDTTDDEWTAMYTGNLEAIPAPYDDLYVDYLVMRIDLENADYERYNNGAELYARKLQAWLNRLSNANMHRKSRTDPKEGLWRTHLKF